MTTIATFEVQRDFNTTYTHWYTLQIITADGRVFLGPRYGNETLALTVGQTRLIAQALMAAADAAEREVPKTGSVEAQLLQRLVNDVAEIRSRLNATIIEADPADQKP